MTQIRYPKFFNRVPMLRIRDKLAEFLSTAGRDIVEYRYAGVTHPCGYSCPTIVSVYLIVLKGLQVLYGAELPRRDKTEVVMQGARNGGTVGITAAVAQLLAGTAPETGLGGIGPHGRSSHCNLLSFDADIDAVLILRYKDNGKTVAVSLNADMYPFVPETYELMPKAVGGAVTPEKLKRFGELWQIRVKAFPLDLTGSPQSADVRAA